MTEEGAETKINETSEEGAETKLDEMSEERTDTDMTEGRESTEYIDNQTVSEGSVTRTEDQIRVFIAMMTLEVLQKSGIVKASNKEKMASHTERLLKKAMERYPITEWIFPNRSCHQVAKAVLTELRGKFGDRLKYMLVIQDSAVEAFIVQCFHAHVTADVET
ncbi:hypothetical protein F2P81_001031 [Scophthalmus maximus]|uniref:Uncharacterized protein n=1 Tax=Scophthalmus maximus TaxID=52904 RepID=A0A6A4TST2_SCOMX|nr:hypothetical protein F2P81_001031 [Scophthalmus maximus]